MRLHLAMSCPPTAIFAAALSLTTSAPPLMAQERRPLRVHDLFPLRHVADPRLSPDGRSPAYTVTRIDAKDDESDTDIFMAPVAGGEPVRLTSSKKSESSPRWSPDNRSLAFLSGREGKKTQVWLLDRRGGDAVKLT